MAVSRYDDGTVNRSPPRGRRRYRRGSFFFRPRVRVCACVCLSMRMVGWLVGFGGQLVVVLILLHPWLGPVVVPSSRAAGGANSLSRSNLQILPSPRRIPTHQPQRARRTIADHAASANLSHHHHHRLPSRRRLYLPVVPSPRLASHQQTASPTRGAPTPVKHPALQPEKALPIPPCSLPVQRGERCMFLLVGGMDKAG